MEAIATRLPPRKDREKGSMLYRKTSPALLILITVVSCGGSGGDLQPVGTSVSEEEQTKTITISESGKNKLVNADDKIKVTISGSNNMVTISGKPKSVYISGNDNTVQVHSSVRVTDYGSGNLILKSGESLVMPQL